MLIVKVKFNVKKDMIARFMEITRDNVRNYRLEPGIPRFELLKDVDKETVFYLIEAYTSAEDQAKDRETVHYTWRKSLVTDLLEQPYEITKMSPVEPVHGLTPRTFCREKRKEPDRNHEPRKLK